MSLKVTILGCGSSGGVPRIGNEWGACDPESPRTGGGVVQPCSSRAGARWRHDRRADRYRSRHSRAASQRAGDGQLDGVIYTHDHADHTHGVDDLRMVCVQRRADGSNVYHDAATGRVLASAVRLLLRDAAGKRIPGRSESRMRSCPARWSTSRGRAARSRRCRFASATDSGESLGFRFGGLAYSPDVSDLPEETLPLLEGLDVWIVDALTLHSDIRAIFSVEQSLSWIARLKPKRAVLTHMHVDLDYADAGAPAAGGSRARL